MPKVSLTELNILLTKLKALENIGKAKITIDLLEEELADIEINEGGELSVNFKKVGLAYTIKIEQIDKKNLREMFGFN
jgi:chromosomal replication initiation ATPase DnaA